MDRLLIDAHALAARWWDDEHGLLMAPAGRHGATTVPGGTVGLLAPTVWWAYGLLRRGQQGDGELASRALRSVAAMQYDAPGRDWHGSWPATSLEPHPQPGAVAFEDHDPNLRVFVAASIALVLRDHPLPDELATMLRTAVTRAVHAEPTGRIDPSWTNVAVQLAWLELEAGRWLDDAGLLQRGGDRAKAIAADTRARGHVAEHLSPTYTGMTMVGLSLWADRPPVQGIASLGHALRDEVWHDLLAAWHPGLATLVPPFTRAFGVDLREHVGATAPWLAWLVDGAWPLPELHGPQLHQGHDLPIAFLVDGLAGAGEDVLSLAPMVRAQPARQGYWTDEVGLRRWSGWTGLDLAVGAESSQVDWAGWWQMPTAMAIWRAPDGTNAWLRVHQSEGCVDAHVLREDDRVLLTQHAEGHTLRLVFGGVCPDRVTADEVVHGGRTWLLGDVTAVERQEGSLLPDGLAEVVLEVAGPTLTLETTAHRGGGS